MIYRLGFILFLITGLAVGVYLVTQKTNLFSRAIISGAPSDIKISNISDNSFTVSWTSQKPVIGFVSFGPGENLGNMATDDRDTNGPQSRMTHHVAVKDLEPSTSYFYTISSGGETYQDQDKPFTQITAPTTSDTPPLAEPIFGKAAKSDNTPPSEALIYSKIDQSSLLSTYTKADGSFLITLNNARTEDLSTYTDIKDSDAVNFFIITPAGSTGKQVLAGERQSAISITLDDNKTANKGFIFEDLNNDGIVNVFDFATFIKRTLTK